MNVFGEAYARSIAENRQQSTIWENYLQNLNNLDFNCYFDKIKVPSLIPIGSRMFFRGDLIHTNEITVSLGANYFAKCSAKQAEVLKQHRILDAQEKLSVLIKERDYLENQLSFTRRSILEDSGQEIIESYSEEQEFAWRLKHKENIKKYKQESKHAPEKLISDDDLWSLLDQLELQEEYEEQNAIQENGRNGDQSRDSNVIDSDKWNKQQHAHGLKNQLLEIASKETVFNPNEENMLKMLDDLEEQEELEDKLDRLQSSGLESQESDDDLILKNSKKKTLSFASDDEPVCIKINFKHSEVSPDLNDYNRDCGIAKPSDIYAAFPENFKDKTIIPILKKTPYITSKEASTPTEISKSDSISLKNINVMGEVIENTKLESKITKTTTRPPSKFKTMRMQTK